MKYLLGLDHYINDMIVPAGSVVGLKGDEGIVAYWVKRDGETPEVPSMNMEPLDKEAEEAMKKRFPKYGTIEMPSKDFMARIPVQGTGSGVSAPGPGATPQQAVKPMSPVAIQPTQAAAPKSASQLPAQKPGVPSVSDPKKGIV